MPREVIQSSHTQYETSSFTVIVVRNYKDSLMKLRISDAIDCTCTTGGWSRELNPATQERKRGWGDWDGGWSMLSQSNTGEKDRTSEWMNGYQSVPSLCWSGSCRVCKSTSVSPLRTPFLLIPWSPLRILPLRTRLTPEHNGRPISFLPRFYLLVFKYMPSLNVRSCLYSLIFAVFRFARISRTRIFRYMNIVTVKSSVKVKGANSPKYM